MNYSNEQIEQAINQYIHNATHREILKSRLIDGVIFDDLAEMYNYSTRHIKRIVYKGQVTIFKALEKR